MIQRSAERCALPREVINFPARLSFDGIAGHHPCLVRDISAFGACISTPYYTFAGGFDLSFGGFHRTFACRLVWRRATLCGVAFARAPELVSANFGLASIIQSYRPNALAPMRSVEL
jgi:hypothetical protein